MDFKQILINLIGEVLGIGLLLIVFLGGVFWAKVRSDKHQDTQESSEEKK